MKTIKEMIEVMQAYERGEQIQCKIYVELNHVHELQHALRMCGIEKEIEL